MRLLALDTLGPSLSAAAAFASTTPGTGAIIAAERAEAAERGGQAERILPLTEEVLAEAGWAWRDLDLIAVTVGPGGFTAVRTGVALARALALALGRPALAVGALEATAESAVAAAGPGPLLALRDLRRGQLAAQAFDADLLPRAEVRLLGADEALAAAAEAPRLAGDGAVALALAGSLADRKPIVEAAPAARYVAAAACRRLARGELLVAGTELRPFYLRPPDARPAAGRPLVAALAAT